MKILIIDDNKTWRETLIRIVQRGLGEHLSSLWFYEAGTMSEALDLIFVKGLEADITLLDLCLPDSTRAESLARVHSLPPPVIVTSVIDDKETRAAAFAAGAVGYFSKSTIVQLANRLCDRIADVRFYGLQKQGSVPIIENDQAQRGRE